MKNAILSFALIAANWVCYAQQFVSCISSNCYLSEVKSDINFNQQQITIHNNNLSESNKLNEQIVPMKSFITHNTNFKALNYSLTEILEMQKENKKVLEYFVDAKAKEAYIVIYNDQNKIIREYPLDLGMKSYLLVNQKKLREGKYTYKLFIDGIDVCSRSL